MPDLCGDKQKKKKKKECKKWVGQAHTVEKVGGHWPTRFRRQCTWLLWDMLLCESVTASHMEKDFQIPAQSTWKGWNK